MTDVSVSARGMFVCGSTNPWQQKNEHKQHVDKQKCSVPIRLCLWLCGDTSHTVPLKTAIKRFHAKKFKQQKTKTCVIYIQSNTGKMKGYTGIIYGR